MNNYITIKQARLLSDMTKKEMAHSLGITAQTYSKLENSPEKLTIKQAFKISEVTGIEIKNILFASLSNFKLENQQTENSSINSNPA